MKSKKGMLILGIVLVVLLGIYGGLRYWGNKSQEAEAQKEEAETVHVVQTGDLSGFSYTDGTDAMSFAKEEDTWYYEADREIPMVQDTVQTMADALQDVTAVRELQEPDALEDYGLDAPSYTIEYTEEDGETGTLYIGDMTGENYYAMPEGSENVYTIDSTLVSALLFDLADLAQTDSVPSISSGNLVSVAVTENGQSQTFEEEDDLAELAGGFGVLSLTECADYHVTDETLSKYGLEEENRMTVQAVYTDTDTEEEETFTVYVGDEDEDGENRYLMVDGSKMVYKVSTDVIGNMTTVSEGDEAEE